MTDVNTELLDLELRHQIDLHKFSNGEVKKVLKLLREAESEIVERIRVLDASGSAGSFTRARLNALLDAIKEISAQAYVKIHAGMSVSLSEAVVHEATVQAAALKEAIPVNLIVAQPAEAQLRAAIADEPWEGKLLKEWTDELDAATYARVRDQVRLGFVQGETNDQIVARIRGTRALNFKDGVMQISRNQAESFVRTSIAAVANYGRQQVYKENSDIIKAILWTATLDNFTCPVCGSLDGKTFPIDSGPRPPKHRGCRCTTVPVTKSFRELGIDLDEAQEGERASMNGTVPAKTTFANWIKRQPAEIQDDVLGKTKGALLRRGGLEIGDFVNNKSHIFTLDELKARNAGAFKKANIAA